MTAQPHCPQCGREVSVPVLRGLCPACLMALAMEEPVSQPKESPPVKPKEPPPEKIHYFGDYELLDKGREGGMGIVYRARQCSLNRIVALKMLRTHRNPRPSDLERFRIEAEATAALDDDHIVRIFETGEADGQLYFSMEWMNGGTLQEKLRVRDGRPLEIREAVEILGIVAGAVQHAHQHGVLHRDLTPRNILFDAEGGPHVSDFGLAKLYSREEGLTQIGQAMGTPGYPSPEQALGQVDLLTTASDVFSLGAIFYHMLTGRSAFPTHDWVQFVRHVVDYEPVHPRELNRQIPRDLERICLKCLAKTPSDRYHSAQALLEDLERWKKGERLAAGHPTAMASSLAWLQRHQRAVGFAVTMLLGILIGVAVMVSSGVKPVQSAPTSTPALSLSSQEYPEPKVKTARTLPSEDVIQHWPKPSGAERNSIEFWRKRLSEVGIPANRIADLSVNDLDHFELDLTEAPIDNVEFLREMPLGKLSLSNTKVRDLRPLIGSPLREINLAYTHPEDLSPLNAMPLERIILYGAKVSDIRALSIPTLKDLELGHTRVTDLSPLRGLGLQQLQLSGSRVSDLTPLSGLPLRNLALNECRQIHDLTPVSNMPLEILSIDGSSEDLSPLRNLKLRRLSVINSTFTNLSVFANMPIEEFMLHGAKPVPDLSWLASTRIKSLHFSACESIPLQTIAKLTVENMIIFNCGLDSVAPLAGSRIKRLGLPETMVRDISPLATCLNLNSLLIPNSVTNALALRRKPTLKRYSDRDNGMHEPAERIEDFLSRIQTSTLPVSRKKPQG